MGPRSDARWQCRTRNVVRVSLGDIALCWSRVFDGQQDLAHSQTIVCGLSEVTAPNLSPLGDMTLLRKFGRRIGG